MIAIVGGGIAGLAAAFELASRGIPFRLFESADRLGGLIHTERIEGFTIEAGADAMLAQKPGARALCRDLELEGRLIRTRPPRVAFVLHGGKLHPLPSPGVFGIPGSWAGLARYSLLSPAARLRLAMEPILPSRAGRDETVSSLFARRFGSAVVPLLAQPLVGGIHAGDIDRLSIASVAPRLHEAAAHGSVLRWAQRVSKNADPDGAFRSFDGGMVTLVDAIRQRLPQDAIHTGEPVVALRRDERRWNVRTARSSYSVDRVILACPAHRAATLLATVDPALAELCGRVRYVSTVSVALAWPIVAIAHALQGSGFVVARATNVLRITACTWVTSKWEHRAPQGQALLRVYLGGAHDPEAVDLSDDDVVAIATREVSAILGITGSPALRRVFRWRDAGAQHEVGHASRLASIDARLAQLPGLFLTGSGYRVTGVPDCAADGRAIAIRAGMDQDEAGITNDER